MVHLGEGLLTTALVELDDRAGPARVRLDGPVASTLSRVLHRPDALTALPERHTRASSSVLGAFAALVFFVASMAIVFAGVQASATPRDGHTFEGHEVAAGHQPSKTRVAPNDRTDAPLHRTAPWSPAADVPPAVELNRPADVAERIDVPLMPWHGYDLVPAKGRAPPR